MSSMPMLALLAVLQTPALPRGHELDALIACVAHTERPIGWDATTRTWIVAPEVRTLASCALNERLSDAQWLPALGASGVLRTRQRWPRGEPYRVSVCTLLRAWPLMHIALEPSFIGWRKAEYGARIYGCGDDGMPRDFELGRLPDYDVHEIVLHALIERGYASGGPGGCLAPPQPEPAILRGILHVPIEIVATIDDAVPPLSSPALDAAVQSSIAAYVDVEGENQKKHRVLRLELAPDPAARTLLHDVGLSLRVDVLRDEERIATAHLVPWHDDKESVEFALAWGDPLARSEVNGVPTEILTDGHAQNPWHLRVSGTSDDVLHLWNAETRWNGTVDIPLSDALALGRVRDASAIEKRKSHMRP
jgi:hypothetical protein